MTLLDTLKASETTRTFGKITDDSPLTVQFNGTASADAVEGVMRLAHYTPVVGHIVQLDLVGSVWVIQGRMV